MSDSYVWELYRAGMNCRKMYVVGLGHQSVFLHKRRQPLIRTPSGPWALPPLLPSTTVYQIGREATRRRVRLVTEPEALRTQTPLDDVASKRVGSVPGHQYGRLGLVLWARWAAPGPSPTRYFHHYYIAPSLGSPVLFSPFSSSSLIFFLLAVASSLTFMHTYVLARVPTKMTYPLTYYCFYL